MSGQQADARAAGTTPARHALSVDEAVRRAGVDPSVGLAAREAASRRAAHGENRLPRTARRPAWLRLLAQLHNPLITRPLGVRILYVAALMVVTTFLAVDLEKAVWRRLGVLRM
jgi:magnesium-transporting ATPase (P-type)